MDADAVSWLETYLLCYFFLWILEGLGFLSVEQQLSLGTGIWFTLITFIPCRDLDSLLIAGLINKYLRI